MPVAERLAAEEPLAIEHEHARLYDALERGAQLAELAGHNFLAERLRSERRYVADEIAARDCYRDDR